MELVWQLTLQGSLQKTQKILSVASNIIGIFGVGSVIDGIKKDRHIQEFLKITNPLLFKGVVNKEDAMKRASLYADDVETYFSKRLDKQGVSKKDWADAIYDNIKGEKNEIYSKVMDEKKD